MKLTLPQAVLIGLGLAASAIYLTSPPTEATMDPATAARTYLNPESLGGPPPGFSHVVITTGGKLIHISGQTARGADGKLVGAGDLAAQAAHVLKRIKLALAAAGATPDDVVRRRIYVVDFKPGDLQIVREAFAKHLPQKNPAASTLIGISALAFPGYLIEVDVTAHLAD